jgi:two-component system, OmpR family, response regulator
MRILIVEDEHKTAQSLKKGFEQENFSVDIAFNGNDGYDFAATEDYDLIILDLMLPGMNGTEICAKLRARNIQTPILMLTARSELEDKIDGLNTGADDYLTKPFAFEELLARAKAILRRPKESIPSKLQSGNLILDTLTYQVTKDGKPIQLSKREYSLLEYLIRNKGKVLSKDQIIAHVWNYDADILENTVEQYIRYLRKKIDTGVPENKTMIQTVRGFGYKLEENNV